MQVLSPEQKVNNKVVTMREMIGVKEKIKRKLKSLHVIGSLRAQNLAHENKNSLKDLNHHGDHHHHDVIITDDTSFLSEFEEKCPPGGSEKVILYTTSLRGIRKTYEDCRAVRSLLESHKVTFFERDVSLDEGFREELFGVLGGKTVPPRLFIKGRYVGGAEEVVGVLNEQGRLRKLFEGIPASRPGSRCIGCANLRFLVCGSCSGSRKVLEELEGESQFARCSDCNENGLIKCGICS